MLAALPVLPSGPEQLGSVGSLQLGVIVPNPRTLLRLGGKLPIPVGQIDVGSIIARTIDTRASLNARAPLQAYNS